MRRHCQSDQSPQESSKEPPHCPSDQLRRESSKEPPHHQSDQLDQESSKEPPHCQLNQLHQEWWMQRQSDLLNLCLKPFLGDRLDQISPYFLWLR